MSTLSIMDVTGDEKLSWDPSDDLSTARARKRFAELIGKGYKAYRINHVGGKGEKIDEFDPFAQEIVMHRVAVGG